MELARFVENRYGYDMLVDKKGHFFSTIRRNVDGSKIYWRCREYKRCKGDNPCPVRAITSGIHVLKWTEEHNHDVDILVSKP